MDINPVQKAAQLAGSQSALARLIKVTPQAVQRWCETGLVPASRVLDIERSVGGDVSRHELRPDIYPIEAKDQQAKEKRPRCY